MKTSMTREQAWDLLTKYNKDEFHLKHAQVVEAVMRYWAEDMGYDEAEVDFWGIVGPVSYTHLDVYKRQREDKASPRRWIN